MLRFSDPALELAWQRHRHQPLVVQDLLWAIYFTLMPVGALVKWARLEERSMWDVPPILLYMSLTAAFAALIVACPAWYQRHRTGAITLLRLSRTLLFVSRMHPLEALYNGLCFGCVPSTAWQLSWKSFALFASGVTWVTPLRAYLPFQLLFFLLMLRSDAQRCAAECRGACQGLGAAVGAAAASTCSGARAAAFYSSAADWIRRAVPVAHLLPHAWRRGGGGCLAACFSTRGWLQASFGVLLTQALLWAWEERLRWRELQRWRERRRQPRAEQCEARPGPLSWCTLLVWWLGSSWGVWLLLEAALL